jgi:hypothetical protein
LVAGWSHSQTVFRSHTFTRSVDKQKTGIARTDPRAKSELRRSFSGVKGDVLNENLSELMERKYLARGSCGGCYTLAEGAEFEKKPDQFETNTTGFWIGFIKRFGGTRIASPGGVHGISRFSRIGFRGSILRPCVPLSTLH